MRSGQWRTRASLSKWLPPLRANKSTELLLLSTLDSFVYWIIEIIKRINSLSVKQSAILVFIETAGRVFFPFFNGAYQTARSTSGVPIIRLGDQIARKGMKSLVGFLVIIYRATLVSTQRSSMIDQQPDGRFHWNPRLWLRWFFMRKWLPLCVHLAGTHAHLRLINHRALFHSCFFLQIDWNS